MTTFVLVPGFHLGGWAWDAVAAPLRDAGHEVYQFSPSLEPGTTVQDNVGEIADLVRGLDDVVLVGHSYGGIVLAAVADRVPERIRRLVFVDSGPMPDGMCQADFEGTRPESIDGMMPVPESAPPAATGFDWAIIRDRGRPQPLHTAIDPVKHGEAWAAIPRTAVLCSFGEAQLREMAPNVRALSLMVQGEWTYRELRTGHWPMFSEPGALAGILGESGRTQIGV